jgi:hypothetical protein
VLDKEPQVALAGAKGVLLFECFFVKHIDFQEYV